MRERTTLLLRYIDATQFVSLTRVLIYPDMTILELSGLGIYLTTGFFLGDTFDAFANEIDYSINLIK